MAYLYDAENVEDFLLKREAEYPMLKGIQPCDF